MIETAPSERKVQLAPIAEVLAYENLSIVHKFMDNWDVTEAEALDIFQEMKKWLWISADSIRRKDAGEVVPPLAISFSMTLLDEMWHTFILFTREYQLFCNRFFGFYINHAPTTRAQKEAALKEIESDREAFKSKLEAETEAQYQYIYDHLGEETLVKWYSTWTDLIDQEYLNKIRKPL